MDSSPWETQGGFLRHELLRPEAVESRGYQTAIAGECLGRNTLVVIPTGLGKTVIAALVIAERLREASGRALFLAPSRPLAPWGVHEEPGVSPRPPPVRQAPHRSGMLACRARAARSDLVVRVLESHEGSQAVEGFKPRETHRNGPAKSHRSRSETQGLLEATNPVHNYRAGLSRAVSVSITRRMLSTLFAKALRNVVAGLPPAS